MILVDSSVWIPFFNAKQNPKVSVLKGLIEDAEDVCLTVHIMMEILQGFREDRDFQEVNRYLQMFSIFDLRGVSSYIAAAQIYRQCRKQGITIRRSMDCMIAQTAIENGLILLHDDADFDRIAAVQSLQLYK
jgi:predicted nucleic acid-binding protein